MLFRYVHSLRSAPSLCSLCLDRVKSQQHSFRPSNITSYLPERQSRQLHSKSFIPFSQLSQINVDLLSYKHHVLSRRSIHQTSPQNIGINMKKFGLKNGDSGFGVIKPEANVIGLVHPELMNRQRVRYPLMWLSCAYVIGLGTYLQFSNADFAYVYGIAIQVYPIFIITTMWYNSRCVGKIVLNDDSSATISHLNMYGRRVNQTVSLSDLKLMTKHDHKQVIGGKMLFIDWDKFKTNDKLWEYAIPAQKQRVLIADDMQKGR